MHQRGQLQCSSRPSTDVVPGRTGPHGRHMALPRAYCDAAALHVLRALAKLGTFDRSGGQDDIRLNPWFVYGGWRLPVYDT